MNLVVIKGNLTRDPELRYTPKGTAVANLGLAVNRKWKDEAGQTKEEVHFFNAAAWGRTAETIGQYFAKGSPILITGRLTTESWDDKQTGQKKSAVKIVIESFDFCGDTKKQSDQPREPRAARPASAPVEGDGPRENDDVPF